MKLLFLTDSKITVKITRYRLHNRVRIREVCSVKSFLASQGWFGEYNKKLEDL